MLVGSYKRTVDDKWRLPVPSELLASEPGEGHQVFYFAPADDHLILFSERTFRRLADQLMERSVMAHRQLRRQFFGLSFAKKRDKNGRIQVPEALRDLSGLAPRGEVVIVGTGPYAEIRPVDRVPAEPDQKERANILDALEAIGEGA
ncbi:MAG: division/cell wall cluster transcriptional repressor MraZ [Planctomycetota bacterium]|jgi:DNA-binding transcriptional regulator/RsmH inhibitor MraZ